MATIVNTSKNSQTVVRTIFKTQYYVLAFWVQQKYDF